MCFYTVCNTLPYRSLKLYKPVAKNILTFVPHYIDYDITSKHFLQPRPKLNTRSVPRNRSPDTFKNYAVGL